MSDELFQRSIKITNSLIEQIGEQTLQAACAKLSAQCGGDTSKVTQPANPERDLETSMQSEWMDDTHADVQAIYDVSYALDMAWSIALEVSLLAAIVFYVVGKQIKMHFPILGIELLAIPSFLILVVFIISFIRVWRVHQPAVIFEFGKSARVSFCAQDMENSVFDYLFFRKFRNSWQRKTVSISDIYRIDNEIFQVGSKRKKKCFSINISGNFGSQKIVFSNKQKRDECRALFSVAIKKYAKNARMDSNLSIGSSGDSGF